MNAVAESALATRHTAAGNDALCLTEIFDPEIQLVLWQRAPVTSIESYLDTLGSAVGPALRTTFETGQTPTLAGWPAGAGRDALATDIAMLAELYGDLLGCPQIGLRLEILNQAMCPRFHVDRVGIRLLCTYRGPGTQWLDDSKVDRQLFWLGEPDKQPPSGDAMAESAAPHTVALLKGSLWQGNSHRGIIHRSPAVPDGQGPRVVVAMDAIW